MGLSGSIIKNVKSVIVPSAGGMYGIVAKGVENTIHNMGKLARNGILEADKEISCIMLNITK